MGLKYKTIDHKRYTLWGRYRRKGVASGMAKTVQRDAPGRYSFKIVWEDGKYCLWYRSTK